MMESDEKYYECEKEERRNKEPKRKNCYCISFVILVIALAFSLGLLLGGLFAIGIIIFLPALIAIISILVLLIIINLVLIKCDRRKYK